jgi:large subunit ribosomal protein L29
MAKRTEEITTLTDEQLRAKLVDTEKEFQKQRFAKITGELTQTHLLQTLRKDVARIKTELNKRTRAAANADTNAG